MKHVICFLVFVSLLVTLSALNDQLMKFSVGTPITDISVNNQSIIFVSSIGIIYKQNYLDDNYVLYENLGVDPRSIINVWSSDQENIYFVYYQPAVSNYKIVKLVSNELTEYEFPIEYAHIRKSLQDSSDRLWFVCDEKVLVFDLNLLQWQIFSNENTSVNISDITDICEDYNHDFWFSTNKANIITFQNNVWQSNPVYADSIDFFGYSHIAVNSNNDIMLSDENNLYLLRNYELIQTIQESGVRDLKVLNNDFYFVNSLSEVYRYMHYNSLYYMLADQYASDIALTNSHLILYNLNQQSEVKMASYDFLGVVSQVKTGNFKFILQEDYYEMYHKLFIQADCQKLWFKTSEGISYLNNEYQWTYYDIETTGIDMSKLTDLCALSNEELIGYVNLGENSHFIRFNGSQWLMDPPLNNPSTIVKNIIYDQNNVLWAVSNRKLAYLSDDNAFFYVNPSLQRFEVISPLYKVGNEEIWFTSINGNVYSENINTKTFRLIYETNPSQEILIIKINNENDYWLYTRTQFMHIINGQTFSYNLPNMSDNIVDCDFDNSGKLWIKTSYALYSWENDQFTIHWQSAVRDEKFYSESLKILNNNNVIFYNNNVIYVYNQNSLSVTEQALQDNNRLNISVYPNPFNPSTRIAFTLEDNSPVTIKIFNIKGQIVKDFTTQSYLKGDHTVVWDGNDNNNNHQSSGIYFVKIQTSNQVNIKKMMMVK